jgi:putative restriction endonuclease
MTMADHIHTWEELVGRIGTWKDEKRGQVAPHKPLLVLLILARAQRGEGNVVRFADVDGPLKQLLREFGPERKSYHPEYPFWYLKNDGFWHVHQQAFFERPDQSRKGKTQPTRSVLLSNDARAEVPELFWKQLQKDPSLLARLARRLLEDFWPEDWHEEILGAVGLELGDETETVQRRRRDPGFRLKVLQAYERKCAVCGFDARLGDALFGLEAAHIRWHQYHGPDVVPNGLALCSLHHKAFDRGAMGLDDNLVILISRDVSGHDTVRRVLTDYAGKDLRRPIGEADLPEGSHLHWHRKNVFRGGAR